jgi:hypothetical protein
VKQQYLRVNLFPSAETPHVKQFIENTGKKMNGAAGLPKSGG